VSGQGKNYEHKNHEHSAEALSEKLENSAKLRKRIMQIIVAFLILVFIVGMAWGAQDLLAWEGQMFPAQELDASITNPPDSPEEIFSCLQTAIENAEALKPKLNMSTNFDFHGDSVSFTGNAAQAAFLTSMLQIVEPELEGQLHNTLPNEETAYGGDPSELLWDIGIAPEASCDFIFYRCPDCGREDSVLPEDCPDCDSTRPYEEKYRDAYTLTLSFPDDYPGLGALFHERTPDEIMALMGGGLDGYASISSIGAAYRNTYIMASVNRTNGKLNWLSFKKDIDLVMDLRLDPALADMETALTCTLHESTDFNFTWPGVRLSSGAVTLKKGETVQLTAGFDAPEGQRTPHLWASSDPEICAVEQDGYIKAGKTFGEAVITCEFELDGETYVGECAVSVKVPVEKASLNRNALRMKPGDTKRLKVSVSPNKATYKDVAWYTEDETVAAVSDGVVTAVGAGETTVYAVTADGYYKTSCKITVGGAK